MYYFSFTSQNVQQCVGLTYPNKIHQYVAVMWKNVRGMDTFEEVRLIKLDFHDITIYTFKIVSFQLNLKCNHKVSYWFKGCFCCLDSNTNAWAALHTKPDTFIPTGGPGNPFGPGEPGSPLSPYWHKHRQIA